MLHWARFKRWLFIKSCSNIFCVIMWWLLVCASERNMPNRPRCPGKFRLIRCWSCICWKLWKRYLYMLLAWWLRWSCIKAPRECNIGLSPARGQVIYTRYRYIEDYWWWRAWATRCTRHSTRDPRRSWRRYCITWSIQHWTSWKRRGRGYKYRDFYCWSINSSLTGYIRRRSFDKGRGGVEQHRAYDWRLHQWCWLHRSLDPREDRWDYQ